ncbi:gamma-tubulin [Striga asiatica]|uniref:Gamma-tubulin n=1 Tax=Striga asiatica TaxID=4170 RepID=A0A5A7QZF4_STRAF|nr:gamma-tubulin [Striga asiatica]
MVTTKKPRRVKERPMFAVVVFLSPLPEVMTTTRGVSLKCCRLQMCWRRVQIGATTARVLGCAEGRHGLRRRRLGFGRHLEGFPGAEVRRTVLGCSGGGSNWGGGYGWGKTPGGEISMARENEGEGDGGDWDSPRRGAGTPAD